MGSSMYSVRLRGWVPQYCLHDVAKKLAHLNKINGGRCAREPPLGRHVRVAPRDPHAAACGSAPPTHAAGDARKRDPLARPRHLAPLTQAQNSAQVTLHQADRATAIDANVLDDERRGNRRAIRPITLVTHRVSPRKILSPVARALRILIFPAPKTPRGESNRVTTCQTKSKRATPSHIETIETIETNQDASRHPKHSRDTPDSI